MHILRAIANFIKGLKVHLSVKELTNLIFPVGDL